MTTYNRHMEDYTITEFKQNCLRLLDDKRGFSKPILVHKRNKPIAYLVPVSLWKKTKQLSLKGSVKIHSNKLEEISFADQWENL